LEPALAARQPGRHLVLRYRPAYVVLALGAGVAVLWPLWRGFVIS
jgi:hypothetical protein